MKMTGELLQFVNYFRQDAPLRGAPMPLMTVTIETTLDAPSLARKLEAAGLGVAVGPFTASPAGLAIVRELSQLDAEGRSLQAAPQHA